MELTEAVRLAQEGDRQAAEELYRQTCQRVYALALRLTNNPDRAMDAVQETYLSALQHLDNLRSPEAFPSWILQIAANCCHRIHRQEGHYVSVSGKEDGDSGFLEAIPDPDEGILPESAVEHEETRRLVLGLVQDLPDTQRECVILFYFSRFTVEEIAQIQNCSTGTVKSRLNYARKKLKTDVLALKSRDGIRLHTLVPIGLLLPCVGSELPAATAFAEAWQAVTAGLGAAGAGAAAAGAHALGTGTAVKGAAAGALKVKIAAGIAAVGLVAGGVGVALHEPAITFQDPVFEHNIRILLDKPEGPLRTSDLAQIGSLYITADGMALEEIFSEEQMACIGAEGTKPVSSLEDLDLLPNLTGVFCRMSDDTALLNSMDCDSLRVLMVSADYGADPRVTDLDFLADLPGLESLNLSVSGQADLEPLENCSTLTSLSIQLEGNDLDLSHLTSLRSLAVSNYGQTSAQLTASSDLPQLKLLYLFGPSGLDSLEFLSHAPQLEYLRVYAWSGMDLTPLSQLEHFRMADIHTMETPVDLTPLTLCPSLEACCLDNAPEGSVVPAQLPMATEGADHGNPTYDAIHQSVF